jgi:hypothetical protein
MDPNASGTAHLDALERQLAELTAGWARSVVIRSFGSDNAGQEDYRDEALLFEMHGYVSDAPEGVVSQVMFTRAGASLGPNEAEVLEIIDRARTLTAAQVKALYAAETYWRVDAASFVP